MIKYVFSIITRENKCSFLIDQEVKVIFTQIDDSLITCDKEIVALNADKVELLCTSSKLKKIKYIYVNAYNQGELNICEIEGYIGL